MKRAPIGFDSAATISDVLGVPKGSSWNSHGTPPDDTDAAPAFTTESAIDESGIDVHAAGIDLQVNVPVSDILFAAATPTSSTDADIVSIWASPPSQPAETRSSALASLSPPRRRRKKTPIKLTRWRRSMAARDCSPRRLRPLPSFRRCPRI